MQSLRHSSSGPSGPLGHEFYLDTSSSMASTVHRSLSGSCSSTSVTHVHRLLSGVLLLWHGFSPWTAGVFLHPCAPPWAAGGQLLYHGLYRRPQGNLSSGACSASSLSFCTDLGVCRDIHLTHSHPALLQLQLQLHNIFFFSFLSMLPQRAYHHFLLAQPWLAVALFWDCLALALLDMEGTSRSFSQKPPL